MHFYQMNKFKDVIILIIITIIAKTYYLIPGRLHITTQNFNFCTPHAYLNNYFRIFPEL